tara:strand:+ start:499 stop:666 length:168 start_codon:yes stop_codon:yes gene_type:complete
MRNLIMVFLFLSACSSTVTNKSYNNGFDLKELSFNQFSKRLKEYVLNNPFPDIEK